MQTVVDPTTGADYTQWSNVSATGVVTAEISGTGANFNANNAHVTLDAGSTATFSGQADTVAASNDTFSIGGDDSFVTIVGSGNTVSLVGTYGSVRGDNDTFNDLLPGSKYGTFSGSNDVVNVAGGSAVSIGGSNDQVNAGQGGGASGVSITGGTQDVVNGSTANLSLSGDGTQVTLAGTAGSSYLGGSNDVLSASNATVSVLGRTSGYNEVTGSNDTITPANVGGSLELGDGSQNMTVETRGNAVQVDGSYGSMDFAGGGSGILNGYNETVALGGGTSQVSIGGKEDVVQGSGIQVDPLANTQVTVAGTGDTISVNASGDGITAADSTIDVVGTNLSGDNLFANDDVFEQSGRGDRFDIAGTGDSGSLSGDSLAWLGSTANDNVSCAGGAQVDTTDLADYGSLQAPPSPIFTSDGGSATHDGNFVGEDSSSSFDDDSNYDLQEQAGDGDPIVLALGGGNVQTQSLANSHVYFDEQNNGNEVRTGWGTAGEGYLVYDPDNQNTIVDGQSLVSGFAALTALDSNHDGVLNALDTAWSHLKVWVDAAGTGQESGGSLSTLASLGIASIDLHSSHVDSLQNGNRILDDGRFTWANGGTGDIAGIEFAFDPNTVGGRERIPTRPVGPEHLVSAGAGF